MKNRATPRLMTTLFGVAACLLLSVGMASPAPAVTGTPKATAATVSAPARVGQVCTVRATAFVHKGHTNVVTATQTTCGSAVARTQDRALPNTALANVHVGYGCDGDSFTSTCWWFDVPSPGCAGSSSWGWDTISQNNVLSSWEAVGTCSHGRLYDLPVYGGTAITCYTCYSLGSMNNRTTSLKVFR